MQEGGETGRRAMRSARELAHLATSIASEAANLTRALEAYGTAQASIAASHASIQAAQGAFAIDAIALDPGGAGDLHDVLLKTDACLEAASQAVEAARGALRAAAGGLGPATGNGDAMGA